MPDLKNPKHEIFAVELAKGETQLAAYAAAGYRPSEQHASRLASNGKVLARIAEIQARAARKAVVTIADIAKQLDEDRAFAIASRAPAACVAATMGKAKVLGLIVDKQAGADGGPVRHLHRIERVIVDPANSDR